jgi:hypothetical protein
MHRVPDLRTDEVVLVDGIPVTTPARTLLDIAELEPLRAVEQAYANALRKRLVTLAGCVPATPSITFLWVTHNTGTTTPAPTH